MSLRVTSSGYMPPVSSKSARRSSPSPTLKRFATPGSHQTGSIAILVTAAELSGNSTLPSTCRRWKARACLISCRWMCALVTAMVGRMS